MNRCIFFIFVFCIFQLSYYTVSAQRVGLVLSGGGARGLSHIGVIKALEEQNIPIDYVAGTSSGALVGALYAMGYSVQEMEAIVRSNEFYNWTQGIIDEELHYYFRKPKDNASWITIKFGVDSIFSPTIPNRIVNTSPMEFAMMERMAPSMAISNNNFDSLFIPFRCVASDIVGKKQVIFKNGDLARAVRASVAYPFVFSPVVYNGMILFDGGIYNNFPADIVLEDFYPDIIIGVKVSGDAPPPATDNIISQLRTMLVQSTNYSVICENGIIIEPQVDQFSLMDFKNPDEIIKAGYVAAQKRLPEIERSIERRIDQKELTDNRKAYRANLPKVLVDSIIVKGITPEQADYVRRVMKPRPEAVSLKSLEAPYFKLVADNNIKSIFPVLIFDKETGFFYLELEIEKEKDIITEFGGNFSSRPINEAFIGVQYNVWGKQSLSLRANTYFGKLYSSIQFAPRLDVPYTVPFYIEPRFTMNRWDFFKSSTAFFEDVKPSYLVQTERIFNLDFGIPARNKGKLIIGNSVVNLDDSYYQDREFTQSDTADGTKFNAFSSSLTFERSTMNRKMYANQGTYFLVSGRFVDGIENYVPGSTSPLLEASSKQLSWYQLRVVYDNYFERIGPLKLGFLMESMFSNQPFFSNYTSSVLRAQAFQPLQETRTLFLENFRAHNYVGGGLRTVLSLSSNIDLRFEAYGFQPFQEFIQNEDRTTKYGDAFKVRYYIGSAQGVYHSPVGPLSLSVNYYDKKEQPFSVLFHFGYILFNERAFD